MIKKIVDPKFLSVVAGLIISVMYLLNVDTETINRWYVMIGKAVMISTYIFCDAKIEMECEKIEKHYEFLEKMNHLEESDSDEGYRKQELQNIQ